MARRSSRRGEAVEGTMGVCPRCGGREFGFVFEPVMPGLYGTNLYGEVVSIDNTMCMNPVFTCKNCYAGHHHEPEQGDEIGLIPPITEDSSIDQ
jgi:hypothetical protein